MVGAPRCQIKLRHIVSGRRKPWIVSLRGSKRGFRSGIILLRSAGLAQQCQITRVAGIPLDQGRGDLGRLFGSLCPQFA